MGGVGIQEFFILVFAFFAYQLHRVINREADPATKAQALRLLYTLYAVLTLITVSSLTLYGDASASFSIHLPPPLPPSSSPLQSTPEQIPLTQPQVRIIFRLCEYSKGMESTIPLHEAYQYCLDTAPMLLALVALNIVHPGRIMPGKESDLPSRKERKRAGVRRKADRLRLPVQEVVVEEK